MPVDYPLRTPETENIKDICKCGHSESIHEVGSPEKCMTCTCPSYEFELVMNNIDYRLLQRKVRNKKIKDGYVI